MKSVLVTGINGFVGKHLARELAERGHRLVGAGHLEAEAAPEIKQLLDQYIQCDITDVDQVKKLPLGTVDSIINLAGLANVGASFDNPELYMNLNVAVLSVLGNAFYAANPTGRMIAISTGAVYRSDQPMPLTEESATVTDGSPYALSKLKMEETAAEFTRAGHACIVVRPFNHIGPGQAPGFLLPDLYQKLAAHQKTSKPVAVGNLSTVRDYTDVRDIVAAYMDLVESPRLSNNIYNACSRKGASGEEILAALCKAMNIDRTSIDLHADQSLIRPDDPPKIIGDHSKLTNDTGWMPKISLKTTIQDFVDSKRA
jgi:GDP-4-dehydro-6-deoxy-D-mannose reductase